MSNFYIKELEISLARKEEEIKSLKNIIECKDAKMAELTDRLTKAGMELSRLKKENDSGIMGCIRAIKESGAKRIIIKF